MIEHPKILRNVWSILSIYRGKVCRKLIVVPSPTKRRETLVARKHEPTSGRCVRLEYLKIRGAMFCIW